MISNVTVTVGSRSAPSWHALYTRDRHEKAVAKILSGKGFEVFLPLYLAVHRWKDRDKQLSLPLFPCYVFIHGGAMRHLDIVTTSGVHGFVEWGGIPAAIPDQEIEQVRQVVTRCTQVEPHPYLKCGDRVRVKAGPLTGIEGILVRKKNLYRLVLSVELLEKSVALEVDASIVERIPYERARESAMRTLAWTAA